MNIKQVIITRILASLVLTAVLCLTAAMPAFAADGPISSGSDGQNAKAAITTILKIAEGTDIPDSEFIFTLTRKAVAGVSVDAVEMPVIGPFAISYSAADTGKAKEAEDGVVRVPKELEIFGDVEWPHAGVYVYAVKETEGGDTQITYSAAQYDVYVYVANKEDGSGLYMAGIGARIADNDESNKGADLNTKVDPAPGAGGGFEYSQIVFTNTYLKKYDEKDPAVEANWKLSAGKTVLGPYADQTKYFDFEIDMKKPATLDGAASYRAYVVEMAGGIPKVVTDDANCPTIKESTVFGNYIEVKAGTPVTVSLKHGQQLVFTGIHDGANYIITEKGAVDYTGSVVISESGSENDVELFNDASGEDRSTAPDDDMALRRFVNDTGNTVSFHNQYKEVSPMGIGIDSFPYAVVVAVAIAGLAVFMVFKYRRNTPYEK